MFFPQTAQQLHLSDSLFRTLGQIFGDGNSSRGISKFRDEHDCSANIYCLHFRLTFPHLNANLDANADPDTNANPDSGIYPDDDINADIDIN